MVDGAEAANTNYYEKKFYEVAPNWGQVGWTILTAPIIMSEKKFQSLPADVQTALLEGGAKAAEWEQDHYAAVDAERLGKLEEVGVKVTALDPVPFREAAKKVYDEFLTDENEKRLLQMILDTK